MSKKIDIILPADEQEGTEASVAQWLKVVGDSVKLHEPLVEINTDKVTMEIPAPAAGILSEILIEQDKAVSVGEVLGRIELATDNEIKTKGETQKRTPPTNTPRVNPSPSQRFSPSVRKLLKEHNLDPAIIHGSGRQGRVTLNDVENFLSQRNKSSVSFSGTLEPHTPMRKAIASRMVTSLLHTAPHVTTVFEADFSNLIAHRKVHKQTLESKGSKLTFTSYFIKAAVAALQKVPEANSRWHEQGLERFDYCNIGIATALDQGLVVPVLKNVESLSLTEIATELQTLTEKARQGKLAKEDMQGGTFTISNHGVSGSLFAAPIIINQPESAILGVGKLEQRVVVDPSGEVVVRPRAYITLSIDHRVLDGARANLFLQTFVQHLELCDPAPHNP